MEPVAKKTKLTDHFRVALKPRDLNVGLNNNNNKQQINHNTQKQQQHHEPSQSLLLGPSGSQQQPATTSHPPNALKETRSSRENLQLEPLPRKLSLRTRPNSPKKVEIITIDDEDEDDEATEIDEDLRNDRKQPQHQQAKFHRKDETKQTLVKADPPKADPRDRIHDYDETVIDNVFWEPHYACDSFEYDKKQELKFLVRERDLDISPQYRAELVDWLVAIQVRFSLDHEPLYMAVKLADHYLMHKSVSEEDLILLYLTTMFIAAKFDERQSCITMPLIIRQARVKFGVKYTMKQIINLEVDLLTTLDFNLRFPLSYGFLRRFARCTRSDMRTINLARYILESSLMDYDMIETLESEIAAGSLLLAHEMLHHTEAWNATARHYTGYEERELFPLIIRLNKMLLKFSRKKTAIRRKYSHELFMEVAKIPPILPELLLLITSDHQARR